MGEKEGWESRNPTERGRGIHKTRNQEDLEEAEIQLPF
jgi:hypothetical protein